MGWEVPGGPSWRRRLHWERPGLLRCPRFLKGRAFQSQTAWVHMTAVLLLSSVTLSKLIKLFVPSSIHLRMQIIIVLIAVMMMISPLRGREN